MSSTVATLAAGGPAGFQPGQMPPGGPPAGFAGRGGPGALAMPFGPLGGAVGLALLGITLIVLVIVFWRIFSRVGRPGALSLLMMVPVVNLGVLLWFAFAQWPLDAEVARLRTALAVKAANPDSE